jgi:hypothetical protein
LVYLVPLLGGSRSRSVRRKDYNRLDARQY